MVGTWLDGMSPLASCLTPHCTLPSRSLVSAAEVRSLFAVQITELFVLKTLSVYALDGLLMPRAAYHA